MPDRRPTVPRSASHRARRRLTASVALATLALNTACYVYAPVAAAPRPGQRLALELSDQGRVALGGQLGAGVTRVEGTVRQAGSDDLVMAVERLAQISGGTSYWGGEEVRIRRADIARTEERRLSRGRTALAVGGFVVALGAFAVTRVLGGFGGEETTPPPREPPPGSVIGIP